MKQNQRNFVCLGNVNYLNFVTKLSTVYPLPQVTYCPKKVNQFSFTCRLDHLILDETSKENQKEESQEEDFGQMPLGKTQAKYLYPEEKLSLLRKFNVVLDC